MGGPGERVEVPQLELREVGGSGEDRNGREAANGSLMGGGVLSPRKGKVVKDWD